MEVRKLKHSIYCKNEHGRILAEITFPETEEGVYTIERTYVAEDLRGEGLASQLVQSAIDEIHAQGKKAKATCPYASAWMQRHGIRE